ncbi:MAG: ABC transporter permease subunit [Lachnospiraceae bacterium]|nr:ABC transporter permease subunit [Lachnospiraceae bacterium]
MKEISTKRIVSRKGRDMSLFWQEYKMNVKSMVIWALCVGGICVGCLLLYGSLEDSVSEMADVFANMGAFSEALGMDKVNIGTLEGYYAVEISILFSLGGAVYSAMLGAGLVAKEEEGKTYEFLNALPLSRGKILAEKFGAFVGLSFTFHGICVCLVLLGFAWMGSMPHMESFAKYHGAAFFMCLEIGTVCFLLSVICRKRPISAAVGIAMFLYMMDICSKVVPALDKLKYFTPFSYSNAADIFSGGNTDVWLREIGVGAAVFGIALCASFVVYQKKDLM